MSFVIRHYVVRAIIHWRIRNLRDASASHRVGYNGNSPSRKRTCTSQPRPPELDSKEEEKRETRNIMNYKAIRFAADESRPGRVEPW